MELIEELQVNYCFNENNEFISITTTGGRGFIRKEYDSPKLREALNNVSSLLDDAEIFKDSRTTKAGIILFENKKIFVKQFNNKGLLYSLKYIFRKPRPFRVWRAAWALEQAGIPTPKPMAALAEFAFGLFPKNAYLIREVVDDIIPTLDFVKMILLDEELRCSYINSVCLIFNKMHNAGIYHGDAKCSNIYVSQATPHTPYSYGVWDLLSCKLDNREIDTTLRMKEIKRFSRSIAEIANRLDIELPADVYEKSICEVYQSIGKSDFRNDKLGDQ